MKKLLNGMFYFLKLVFFVAALGVTMFILIQMNNRLGKSFMDSIFTFLPYIVLFVLFILNMILRQEAVNKNLFYNLTCCLVFITNLVVSYRAFYDKNMILNEKLGHGINYNFFSDYLAFDRIMIYGLIVANIFFMFHSKKSKIVAVKERETYKKIEIVEEVEIL